MDEAGFSNFADACVWIVVLICCPDCGSIAGALDPVGRNPGSFKSTVT